LKQKNLAEASENSVWFLLKSIKMEDESVMAQIEAQLHLEKVQW
jgi:hypothetical protein